MLAALAAEFVDELVDGTKSAALPLIRAGLHLSYGQLGLLVAVPLVVGSLAELPLGLVAGQGRRRRRAVLAGGVLCTAALVGVAAAPSFGWLVLACTAFFPASGAFVGLSQSALMDVEPSRQQPHMAAWNLAGSAGALAGPLLLTVVLAAGGSWRAAYLVLAALAGAVVVIVAVPGRRLFLAGHESPSDVDADAALDADGEPARLRVRTALGALRDREVAGWLVVLQVSDLLLDVLTGFLAVYLVDVVHATPAQAALGIAVRLGAGLVGDAAFVIVANRISGPAVLRASAALAAVLYPGFLLVPGFGVKLVLLAALSGTTACWYPAAQAGLYGSLPGRSGIAVFLSSAAAIVGAVGPLAVGFLAQRAGLTWALATLAAAPTAILAVLNGVQRRTKDTGADNAQAP